MRVATINHKYSLNWIAKCLCSCGKVKGNGIIVLQCHILHFGYAGVVSLTTHGRWCVHFTMYMPRRAQTETIRPCMNCMWYVY